ncbi:MAG: diphosphomevalonate decarboxylase [Bradymonadales bacterium]|nr:diphosphomevalonate decarboxylase [Bradymonadales bacterium]
MSRAVTPSRHGDRPGSATARAHANLGLVKYWGKRDLELNLPAVGSISAGIEGLWTRTQIYFSPRYERDLLLWDQQKASDQATARVSRFLDLVRSKASLPWHAQVRTTSNIPREAGLASSAAAFASLALAANAAVGLGLDPGELSDLARRGSASAARSLFGGYVELPADEGDRCQARRIAPADHFPLEVALVLAGTQPKAVSSREGMIRSQGTSPFYPSWVSAQSADLDRARQAIMQRDFDRLAETAQHNCLKMHAVAMTSRPPILYPNAFTLRGIELVLSLRQKGVAVFFTLDAGANLAVFFALPCRDLVIGTLDELDCPVQLTRVGGEPALLEVGGVPVSPTGSGQKGPGEAEQQNGLSKREGDPRQPPEGLRPTTPDPPDGATKTGSEDGCAGETGDRTRKR